MSSLKNQFKAEDLPKSDCAYVWWVGGLSRVISCLSPYECCGKALADPWDSVWAQSGSRKWMNDWMNKRRLHQTVILFGSGELLPLRASDSCCPRWKSVSVSVWGCREGSGQKAKLSIFLSIYDMLTGLGVKGVTLSFRHRAAGLEIRRGAQTSAGSWEWCCCMLARGGSGIWLGYCLDGLLWRPGLETAWGFSREKG